jgi:hypothetical protein
MDTRKVLVLITNPSENDNKLARRETCRRIHSQHAAGNQIVSYESRRHDFDKNRIASASLRWGYRVHYGPITAGETTVNHYASVESPKTIHQLSALVQDSLSIWPLHSTSTRFYKTVVSLTQKTISMAISMLVYDTEKSLR